MMITNCMDKFMSKGSTCQKKPIGMLYHTTYVHMLDIEIYQQSADKVVWDSPHFFCAAMITQRNTHAKETK